MSDIIKIKKSQKSRLCAITAMFLLLIITAYLITDQYLIVNPEYTIESKSINNKFNIAVITDLHSMNFGGDNQVVVDIIQKQSPDMIAVVGDIVDEYNSDITNALNIMTKLPQIAPTYYVVGNHDYKCERYLEFRYEIRESGVTILENEISYIDINENKIAILGLISYSSGEYEEKEYINLMKEFCENSYYKILLCHYPEFTNWFFEQDKYYEYDFDLMLSGHTHGGLINLPLFGGLYAPNQGFLPKYSKGMYYIDEGNKNPYYMIISGGLGQDRRFFRINNFPEVVSVTVNPE
ncbi:MAG: metallophosphoesterase [Acutalibacteraceae bacterium]|nr:metallophosphoesterase [Acutalibacteraceae bacterium]